MEENCAYPPITSRCVIVIVVLVLCKVQWTTLAVIAKNARKHEKRRLDEHRVTSVKLSRDKICDEKLSEAVIYCGVFLKLGALK